MVSQEIEQQLTVSPEEAAEIAEEVQELIEAGEEQSAWERVRHLHPADIGIIVASLPRTSRDTIVRVMSPETVAWILRQMNPIEAGRLGTRLGSRMLSLTLGQIHPQEALETLRRLPLRRAKEVAATLNNRCLVRSFWLMRRTRRRHSWTPGSRRSG